MSALVGTRGFAIVLSERPEVGIGAAHERARPPDRVLTDGQGHDHCVPCSIEGEVVRVIRAFGGARFAAGCR